uniref:Ubiquitin carboxyl-terminal hydrolase 17 n=1 Tax=Lygus hesperus TaxID=30085 RepID=A0A0A9WTR8_LYGHE
MQMGITRELSGHFGSSLRWYDIARLLASATDQSRLCCEVHLCHAIACYAIGSVKDADFHYRCATQLLSTLPAMAQIQPLQSYAQVKMQLGDMTDALRVHMKELQLA